MDAGIVLNKVYGTSSYAELLDKLEEIYSSKNIPWVKKRVSTTTIRVQNDESIIIAGLLGSDNGDKFLILDLLFSFP